MYKYKIESLSDSYDCECCGSNFASGYLFVNIETGETVIDMTPMASCFGGDDYQPGDLINKIQTEFPYIKFSEVDFNDCL